MNRSGLLRLTRSTNEIATQTEGNDNLREGSRNFKDSLKIALAALSAAANISPHQSRIAFKVISEKFFGAYYNLSADDTSLEPKHETLRTTEQFEVYKDVLPSVKTFAIMKHRMAITARKECSFITSGHDTSRCFNCALGYYYYQEKA